METNQPTATAAVANPELAISPSALSALGYFCGVAAIVALCVKPYQQMRSVRFHAFQSLIFSVTCVIAYSGLWIVMMILGALMSTILGALKLYGVLGVLLMVGPVLSGVMGLAMLVVWVMLIVAAATGKEMKLPVLGQMAAKFAAQAGA